MTGFCKKMGTVASDDSSKYYTIRPVMSNDDHKHAITVQDHHQIKIFERKEHQNKRTSRPTTAYVELAVATDYSIFQAQSQYVNSTNLSVVLAFMKIYYANLIYQVSDHFRKILF